MHLNTIGHCRVTYKVTFVLINPNTISLYGNLFQGTVACNITWEPIDNYLLNLTVYISLTTWQQSETTHF